MRGGGASAAGTGFTMWVAYECEGGLCSGACIKGGFSNLHRNMF